jgi:hypothetical protein
MRTVLTAISLVLLGCQITQVEGGQGAAGADATPADTFGDLDPIDLGPSPEADVAPDASPCPSAA